MKKMATLIAALACVLGASTAAGAQQGAAPAAPPAQPSRCQAPDYRASNALSWFLGLNPRDNLVATWCRLQAVPGNVRFNVLFLNTQAHRSWDTSFEAGRYGPERIMEIVQSLLPLQNGPVKDENGMPFSRVLENVTQLVAPTAPDGTEFGFSKTHPAAKELVLWEPLVLRVKPVSLAGQAFTLKILMKPSLGWLSFGLQDPRYDVSFRGWKGRMKLGTGGLFGETCSDYIPNCKGLPDAPSFHAPWLVSQVILEADGEAMTAAAASIMNTLATNYSAFLPGRNVLQNFDPDTGKGSITVRDGLTEIKMTSTGSPRGATKIKITYTEDPGTNPVAKSLAEYGAHFRAAGAVRNSAPSVPDSLNRL